MRIRGNSLPVLPLEQSLSIFGNAPAANQLPVTDIIYEETHGRSYGRSQDPAIPL